MSRTTNTTNINIKNPLALSKVVAAKEQGIGRNLTETAENLILRGAEVSLLKSGDPSPESSDAQPDATSREASTAKVA